MDQSGQRCSLMKSLIIDRPDRLSLHQKYANNIFRVFLALAWFYLFIPLLTFINWFFAYLFFEQNLILLEGYKEYETTTALIYLSVIIMMFVFIIFWANFNRLFDKESEAKKALSPVSTQEMSDYFNLDDVKVREYREYKSMKVHFDSHGNIIDVNQH